MAERDDLIAQAIKAADDAGAVGMLAERAAKGVVEAGWRPPAPAGEHAVSVVAQAIGSTLDASGTGLWNDTNEWPIGDERRADLVRDLAAAAVQAMPRPEPAEPLFYGIAQRQYASGEVAITPAWHGSKELPQPDELVAVYRKGDVPGPVRPRPKTDRERWEEILQPGGGTKLETTRQRIDAAIDRLMASGAKLPEPKVRWTVEDTPTRNVVAVADRHDDSRRLVCEDRELAALAARLLNEEDERA